MTRVEETSEFIGREDFLDLLFFYPSHLDSTVSKKHKSAPEPENKNGVDAPDNENLDFETNLSEDEDISDERKYWQDHFEDEDEDLIRQSRKKPRKKGKFGED